jgi:hypothetical protein
MPGYYNSACGVTTTFAPTNNFYFSYGVYDGNMANGTQTGTRGPQFNGYYFNIWEPGAAWEIGGENLPGSFGIGLWSLTASGAKNKGRQIAAMMVKVSSITSSDSFTLSSARLNKPQGLDLR